MRKKIKFYGINNVKFRWFFIWIFSIYCLGLNAQSISFKPLPFSDFRIQGYTLAFTEDFNGDGTMDYYAKLGKSHYFNPTLGYDSTIVPGYYAVLRNQDGSIRSKWKISNQSIPSGIFDFNNDGRKDLLLSFKDSLFIIYRTDTFSFNKKLILTGKNTSSFDNHAVDMNNDGLLDIVSKDVTDSNFYYIMYQKPGDTFTPVYLNNYCVPYFISPVGNCKMAIGDFNHDGKKDLVSYSVYFYSKLYIYLQQDSGKFSVSMRQLPGPAIALAVLDNNHDGWDDILVELGDNPDKANQKLVVIPQVNGGITSIQYIYKYSDSAEFMSALGIDRLYVDDLNCDGYPEVYRFKGNCDWKFYIHDTRIDTTYSKEIKLNLSQTPETYTYDFLEYPGFFDWNGDGKKDLIISGKKKTVAAQNELFLFQNNSVDKNTSLQYLSHKMDTVNSLTRTNCWDNISGVKNDTVYLDTVIKWNDYAMNIYNPQTKLIEKGWYKQYIIYFKVQTTVYIQKSIYEDTLFLSNGMVCGKVSTDTLRRISLKQQFNSNIQKYVWQNFKSKNIDSTFIKPSSISSLDISSYKIYPNPVVDYLNIDIPINISDVTIRFYNNLGVELSVEPFSDKVYDVSKLQPGIYLVCIAYGSEKHFVKFLVDH